MSGGPGGFGGIGRCQGGRRTSAPTADRCPARSPAGWTETRYGSDSLKLTCLSGPVSTDHHLTAARCLRRLQMLWFRRESLQIPDVPGVCITRLSASRHAMRKASVQIPRKLPGCCRLPSTAPRPHRESSRHPDINPGAARNGTAPATVGMEPVLSGPLDPASGPGRRGSAMKCQSGDLPRQAVVHGRRGVRSSERFFLQSAFRSFPGSMPSWHRAKDSRSCVPGRLSMMPGGCTALMLQAAGCRTHLHGAWRSSRQPAPRQTRKKVLAPRFPSTAATVKTSKEREPCRPVITLQPPCWPWG